MFNSEFYSEIHCVVNLICTCILRGLRSSSSGSFPWSLKNNYDFVAVFIVCIIDCNKIFIFIAVLYMSSNNLYYIVYD